MKKFLSLLLALSMTLCLISCGAEKGPDVVVKSFCDAMKQYDATAMLNCTIDGQAESQNSLDLTADMPEEIAGYFKELAGEMTYSVAAPSITNDTASVSVSFSHADITPVMTVVMGEYISQAFALAFSGASDEDMDALFTAIFNEKMDTVETVTSETTVSFPCVKTEDGWKIDSVPEDVVNVLTCNIATALEGFDSSSDTSDDVDEFTNLIDVPVNTEVELATIKIKVTDCVETNELTAEYFEPDVAQEGTKFVVYTVEIENITKEALALPSTSFILNDSQEREYSLYDEALWYFDNLVPYTEYAPNIKQTGNLVFHVPEDCEDYYFALGKSGTNDGYKFMG